MLNHLWQSTLFAIAAALFAFAFRGYRAQVRYWIWFSASCKFLVPFSLLASLGSRHPIAPPVATPTIAIAVQQFTDPFADGVSSLPASSHWLTSTIAAVWACGFLVILWIRVRDWRHIRSAVRGSVPMTIPGFDNIPIRCSPGLLEPGVVGLLCPILLLPAGLTDCLTTAQLHAVLAHELCHLRRRDNLLASLHMLAEALFWFYPLIWWIGARLLEERERACDEDVLSRIAEPRVYAEAILNVCKLYREWPAAYVSGVTGADLKRRIEAIMTHRIGQSLRRSHGFMLACTGIAALALPLIFGQAQSPAPDAKFDVASIKPNNSGANTIRIRIAPGGRLTAANAPLRLLIASAYQMRPFLLSGGPPWLNSAKYDIEAKGPLKPGIPVNEQISQMLQNLLADRFQLKVHRESRERPLYVLLIDNNGPKLKRASDDPCFDPTSGMAPPAQSPGQPLLRVCGGVNGDRGRMLGTKVTMKHLALVLSNTLDRTVLDKTGLDGTYDFNLKWTPDELEAGALPPENSEPSIFTAVREQLGLRIESQRGPVEILVIDHAEKPSEN
jgi:uncharacterized protein (TIGR03435 family)